MAMREAQDVGASSNNQHISHTIIQLQHRAQALQPDAAWTNQSSVEYRLVVLKYFLVFMGMQYRALERRIGLFLLVTMVMASCNVFVSRISCQRIYSVKHFGQHIE